MMVSLGEFKQLDDGIGLVYVVDAERQSFKWTRVNLRTPPARIDVASFDDVLELRLPTVAIGQIFVPSATRAVYDGHNMVTPVTPAFYYVLTAMEDVVQWQLANVDDSEVQAVSLDNAIAYIDMADGYSVYDSDESDDSDESNDSDDQSDESGDSSTEKVDEPVCNVAP